MEIWWPPIVVAPIAFVLGLVFFRSADRMAPAMREMQRKVNGETMARTITPADLRVGAVGWMVFGVFALVMGFVGG